MYIETWYKIHCPNCKKANWLCDGDTSDCTAPSVEAFKCFSCSKCFWLSENFPNEEDPDDLEYHADLGKESPV